MKPNQTAMKPSPSGAVRWAVLTAGLLLLKAGCQTDVGVGGLASAPLIDQPSDVPRFAGIWDICSIDGQPRHLLRLICDGTGDPRELQGGDALLGLPSNLLAEVTAGDCELIHGSPAPGWCLRLHGQLRDSADGRTYAASGRAWQETGRLLVEVVVVLQDDGGTLYAATLNLDLSFAGEPVVLDDEMNRLLQETELSAGGLVVDAARGTLAVSPPPGGAAGGDSIRVVALRSLFH